MLNKLSICSRILLFFMLFGLSAGASAISELESARRAVRLRDFVKAVAIMTPIAENGDTEAQYLLASLYRAGKGVQTDRKRAFEWFSRAAQQGHKKAQYNLGQMYEQGSGTTTDLRQATVWYQKAADQNHRLAQMRIAGNDQTNNAKSGHVLNQPSENNSETKNQSLRWASQRGNETEVASALKAGAEIDHVDRYGRTVLMDAVETGHLKVTQKLLRSGANVKLRDKNGDDAILYAVRHKQPEIITLLSKYGADTNSRDVYHNSALTIASTYNCSACIKALSKTGAHANRSNKIGLAVSQPRTKGGSVPQAKKPAVPLQTLESASLSPAKGKDAPFNGWHPVMIAAWRGNLNAVTQLIENDSANINDQDVKGFTLLSRASAQGHTKIVHYLIGKGARVDIGNNNGDTALLLAAKQGHTSVISSLLAAGSKIDHKNSRGQNALLQAMIAGHSQTTKVLLDSGANVNAQASDGRNILILAVISKDDALLNAVLSHNPAINTTDKNGRTALWHAVNSNWQQGLERLADKNASLNIADFSGLTPLSRAAMKGYSGIFKFLLDQDADSRLSVKTTRDNLLMVIAASGNINFANQFFGKYRNVDVNQRNLQGNTALIQAIYKNHPAMVNLLLKRGADINLRNKKRENARQIAQQSGQKEILALIDTHAPYSKLLGKLY